jgi:hypothetical protein
MSIVDHPEAWPPDFQDYVFLARAYSPLDREDAWRGLCTGELEAVGSSQERADFAPVPLSPMMFSLQPELKDQILDSCAIDEMDRQPISRRIVRRRVPVPHWIYLKRASLDKFWTSTPAEGRLAKNLADQLRKNPRMTRREAAKFCELDERSRALDRVLVKARELADLPAKGAAGRPRKYPRKSPQ